jgi:quercetin dioxygenase-like cupin family protein
MKIVDVKDVQIADTPHKVAVKKLFNFEHATIVHIELKPGEALKRHLTPVDAFFYVLEGNGIVEIGKERNKNPLKYLSFFKYFQLEMFNPDYCIIVRI